MGRLFGTDGIRGIAGVDLTCELAMRIGRAAAAVLTEGCRRRPIFVVGTDTRISSDMLSAAVSAGLCSVGADVISLGVVPTPAVAFLVGKYKADAGIMISASHNTSEYNGIKIFSGDGYKLPDALEERVEDILQGRAEMPAAVTGALVGKISYCSSASKDYIDHLKSSVAFSLDGLRIAVDCANGSASQTAERLFSELGAEAAILFAVPDGQNINENCGSTHLEALAEYVRTHKLDAGVAFDGDADRCLCVDETGAVVDGDAIMAICTADLAERGKLSRRTVVGTIMSNFGFTKFCEENGLRFIPTKVGDRFVLEEMLLEDYSFGGEQSGHVIFRDFATTGDGQLTAIQLLSMMRRKGAKLSELARVMTKYPQTMVNVKVRPESKVLFYTDRAVKDAIDEAKRTLGADGRIVVRPSGTEPLIRVMAEGQDVAEIERIAAEVAGVIENRLGETDKSTI
ncbi:MAG: phosphoglucosamine mutase [Ruminococcaceae bacterium]|nr:phosphoglucosamine mutase [Oscillospiraceae bacterium]